MSPKKSKALKIIDDTPNINTSSKEELLELDLISLSDPEPVDLGDFSAVWQYFVSCSSPADAQVSQKQPLKRTETVKTTFDVNTTPIHNVQLETLNDTPRKIRQRILSEVPKDKNNDKPVTSCGSLGDDFESSGQLSSSYDPDSASQRRKSFLY